MVTSRRNSLAGVTLALLLASGCGSSAQDSAEPPTSTQGSAEQEAASATGSGTADTDSSTTSATPQEDTSSPTSTSEAPTTSESSETSEDTTSASCDAGEIAEALGREDVVIQNCLGDWAYVSSDVPGDTDAFVQRVDGSWRDYDRQPNMRCRPEAQDDGVPEQLLEYFPDCDTRRAESDLGLSTEITQPACDGRGIVVLGSATTPGAYREDVSALLQQYSGSGYLRTDETCPSLAQQTDAGDPIYAVYRPAGDSRQSICAEVREAGGEAYGKRLDETTEPTSVVDC